MAKQVSQQVVVVLALLLALLIIGGTFLTLQELRSIEQRMEQREGQISVEQPTPPRSTGTTGEVTLFVTDAEQG